MKAFKLLAGFILCIALSNCAKGKLCECTTTYSDGTPETIVINNVDYSNIQGCDIYESVTDENGVTITTECITVDKK
ncbi:MAG: hypothetical protein ABF242_02815 [Flavobacteriales bacterium]